MNGVEVEALAVDMLRALGVSVATDCGLPESGWDLMFNPGNIRVELKYKTLIDGQAARRLVQEGPRVPGVTLFVVGDRVTQEARHLLSSHGAGYYDLRGHAALRTESLVIDTDVEPLGGRSERTNSLAGKAGLEVAAALLMQPLSGFGVREVARQVGRAPSTVSEVVKGLARDGLIDDQLRVQGTSLFWRVAETWSTPRVFLAKVPQLNGAAHLHAPLRLGLENVEDSTGWALTDSTAAVAYGAPLAVRADQIPDFFVPDRATLRRAETLLGSTLRATEAASTVRVAPVPAACGRRTAASASRAGRWPLTHPVFVALDLAQDAGRGREVLDSWTPGPRWQRVW